MSAFTQFSIVVDSGGGSTATIVIAIPGKGTGDWQSLAQDVSRNGFFDTAQANFYPAATILKITPQ
jgi:hypothetical protein